MNPCCGGYGQNFSVPGCHGTDVMPPVCYPPIQNVKHNTYTHVIPHIHPIQDIEVDTHVYKEEHYYPHHYDFQSNYVKEQPACCGNSFFY